MSKIIGEKNLLNRPGKSHISLEISDSSFCWTVLNLETNTYTNLYNAFYIDSVSFNEQLNQISKSFTDLSINTIEYNSLSILLNSKYYSIIPSPIFDSSQIENYINECFNIKPGGFYNYNILNSIDSNIIYYCEIELQNFIKKIHQNCRVIHNSTNLISGTLSLYKSNTESKVFVDVNDNFFNIIILQNKTLLLYNTFTYKTKEDFIYYILYIFDQFGLNTDIQEIILLNKINKVSPLYELLYKYIRNVNFIKRNTNFNYSNELENLPEQYYYNLYNLYICE